MIGRRDFLALFGAAAVVPRAAWASQIESAFEAVRDADFIAIGERHDNPRHHTAQASLVNMLKPAGIAFEMVPHSTEAALNDMRLAGAYPAKWIDFLAEAAPGWDWPLYVATMDAVRGAYIAGGGLSKTDLGAVYAKGAAGVGDELAARYGLAEPLQGATRADMLDEQFTAHCEMIEREKLGAMVEVQRAWDAAYAEAWHRASVAGGGRAVLICGNGHARLDRGAPAYLKRAFPNAKIASVGMLETGETASEGHFTVTVTQPAPEREDPCERMRKAMEKKG